MAVDSPTRRRLLLSAVAAVSLAGCSGAPGGTTATDDPRDAAETTDDGAASLDSTASPSSVDGEATEEAAATDAAATNTLAPAAAADERTATSDDDRDLREANVVGVEFDSVGGRYRFDVTLYHDDDGESGYADWWQVETLDGDRLGRRELLHAHSTAPFTRSETVSVPDGTTHVVVRGHDQTHGYGGQAMVVGIDSGAAQAVRQGPEPRSFSDFDPRV